MQPAQGPSYIPKRCYSAGPSTVASLTEQGQRADEPKSKCQRRSHRQQKRSSLLRKDLSSLLPQPIVNELHRWIERVGGKTLEGVVTGPLVAQVGDKNLRI